MRPAPRNNSFANTWDCPLQNSLAQDGDMSWVQMLAPQSLNCEDRGDMVVSCVP